MATTRNQVSYGSQGTDVTELQKLLNKNGYSLAEDGIFGTKTQSAVKDYQQKNNLDVDGIVGTNTWGALTKALSGTTANTAAPTSTPFKYDAYQESDAVKQAQAMLQQQMASKPGSYTSPWQAQLNDTIQKILNREKFSYDLNGDALYQQYKDQYTTQGKMAMMDTMGQAAAMTGGYGNSYAQAVGQQAYQGYLQQLNDKVPELYQLALNQYNQEGQDLMNQYSMLGTQEQLDYGRYRDTVSDYNVELDRRQNQYNTERDYDYGKWTDNRDFGYGQYVDDRNYEYGKFIDDRNYQYQRHRDSVADQQWQKEFDEALRQFNFANQLGEFAPVAPSGGGGYDDGGNNYNPIPNPVEEDDGNGGTNLNEAINKLVRGYDDDGTPYDTYDETGTKKGTASGQQQIRSTVNAAINAAVKDGTLTAKEAAEKKRATRGYTY